MGGREDPEPDVADRDEQQRGEGQDVAERDANAERQPLDKYVVEDDADERHADIR